MKPASPHNLPTHAHYRVGGWHFVIHFTHQRDEVSLRSYEPFRIADVDVDFDVDLDKQNDLLFCAAVHDAAAPIEEGREIGQFDCGGCTTGVYSLPDGGYRIAINDVAGRLCATLCADALFRQCDVTLHTGIPSQRHYGLNNALMMCYAFAAADKQTMLMHASVIRWNGKGYLMTAPSGTGKSTHTRLWHENIPGCDLMNDDNPVVRVIGDEAIIYGSPWSGKTPCYRNIEAPIGGIVRLWQKPANSIRPLSPVEGFVQLLSAMSNMKWDKRVHSGICDGVTGLLRICGMWELGCLPDAAAAHLCHDAIAK